MLKRAIPIALFLATLAAPVFAQEMRSAHPGTLNYVEGQASIEGRDLSHRLIGRTMLRPGQFLSTANGRAEILLTPGVFLRLGNNSTLKMISSDLIHTEVAVTQGVASVEADHIFPQSRILVDVKNSQTQILSNGFYEFNASANTLRVFDGKAGVYATLTPQPNEKPIQVKKGRQLDLTLASSAVKPAKFDRKNAETQDELYRWSSIRSAYLGEANADLAASYAGQSNVASGWMWDPGLYGYTWLPGDGLFWSPFGYGFYSPYYWGGFYGGGFYGGGYAPYHGYGGPGYPGRPGHPGPGPHPGGPGGSGFHGGPGGGGFHGGGGGGGHGGGGGGGHR